MPEVTFWTTVVNQLPSIIGAIGVIVLGVLNYRRTGAALAQSQQNAVVAEKIVTKTDLAASAATTAAVSAQVATNAVAQKTDKLLVTAGEIHGATNGRLTSVISELAVAQEQINDLQRQLEELKVGENIDKSS